MPKEKRHALRVIEQHAMVTTAASTSSGSGTGSAVGHVIIIGGGSKQHAMVMAPKPGLVRVLKPDQVWPSSPGWQGVGGLPEHPPGRCPGVRHPTRSQSQGGCRCGGRKRRSSKVQKRRRE